MRTTGLYAEARNGEGARSYARRRPEATVLHRAGGTLAVIDLPAPSDDDVAELARRVCGKRTAVVDRWEQARGEAEPPEQADELTSLVMADLSAALGRFHKAAIAACKRGLAS